MNQPKSLQAYQRLLFDTFFGDNPTSAAQQIAAMDTRSGDEPSLRPDANLLTLGTSNEARRTKAALMYREMVRFRLHGLMTDAFPKTAKGDPEAFEKKVDEFLNRRELTSRFFREVAGEFGLWLTKSECLPGDRAIGHPCAAELLRLELAQWQVNTGPDHGPIEASAFDLTKPVVFTPTLTHMALTHNVFTKLEPGATYQEGEYGLIVFRCTDRTVETRWMTAPLYQWLVFAMSGLSAADSMKRVLAGSDVRSSAEAPRKQVDPNQFVDDVSGLIAVLLEKGAILGSSGES